MGVIVENVVMEFRLIKERNLTVKDVVVRALRGERIPVERFRALDGVSFAVHPGEALGIIGKNGSGKTTMLRLLAGVLEPSSGTIRVDGKLSTLIDLGAGFNPDLSGEENVYLAGALYGFSRAEMRAKLPRIVEFSELSDFIQVPVKNYSAGMSARLGFSIATDVDPDVLVVDEVLAVGDQAFQEKCLARMREFRRSGKTILLVSHDLATVESFCDRALLLNRGRVVTEGEPERVVTMYRRGDYAQ